MGVVCLDLKVGEAVQIADVACVVFDGKSSNRIKVRIATALAPIRHIPSGIIPRQFIHGLGGSPTPLERRQGQNGSPAGRFEAPVAVPADLA